MKAIRSSDRPSPLVDPGYQTPRRRPSGFAIVGPLFAPPASSPGSDRRAARIPKGLSRKVEFDVRELKAMRAVAIMIRDDFGLILRKYPEPNVAVVVRVTNSSIAQTFELNLHIRGRAPPWAL